MVRSVGILIFNFPLPLISKPETVSSTGVAICFIYDENLLGKPSHQYWHEYETCGC